MREHPLLLNGPQVRATLASLKTQTRTPVKKQPPIGYDRVRVCARYAEFENDTPPLGKFSTKSPMGEAGDRLWVRETFAVVHPCRDVETGYIDDIMQPRDIPKDNADGFWVPWYRAAWEGDDGDERGFRWLPSIHMPRWACRLVLPLVSVRVERVQSISEADAWAEGYGEHWQQRVKEAGADGPLGRPDARGWFAKVWSELYGTWAQNPWVVVYEWGQIEVSK